MSKEILSPIASLKLTLVLLAMAILLVYAGTWAQVDTGIWTVQKIYFHSFYVWINFKTFIPRPPPGQPGIAGGFPFLGGYSIGGLMLINLLSAHAVRFRLTWKRSGVLLIHLGLVLLILGELLTSMLARESQMTIGPGQVCNFSQDTRTGELVVVDPSVSADSDLVVSFPQAQLEQGKTLTHTLVPFEIRIDYYYPNSQLLGPMQPAPPGVREKANAGFVKDQKLAVISKPQVSGTEASVADVASAYVTVSAGGHELGKYLLSYFFDAGQEVQVDGKTYLIALRPLRYYLPHAMSVTLLKFSHDRYLGTDMARNFSSLVRLVDPANNVDRPVLIRMNEPLRYDGQTYYQANFLQDDKTTVLQVVHNPAWTMPYIACVVGALGMLIHFGIMLVTAVS